MSINKLEQGLQETLANGDKIFIPYIMAGDGGLDQLPEQINFLAEAGATAIELGIPFSDPVADGPVIQAAGLRALKQGVNLSSILEILKQTKKQRSIPIVLMTYFNPIYAYGLETCIKDCAEAGVSGLIIPDLPLEEEGDLPELIASEGLALIRLATLTSSKERLTQIAERTTGFLYAVTVTGTTGERSKFIESIGHYLTELKAISKKPVIAGFGVSNPEQVKELSRYCDGVIVGSKIVISLHENKRSTIENLIQATKG
ncbi:tryptophan synthase subunit alpha [Amphibacillus sp. MSJ-3]|uniref:tryptophan synthase subunit alpha n=1 Tax=Amphibacillus sp. MSJ-3 TaxID=2841505 RepID=UPI001C0EC237|nr:tryptophan synthase subunit alpha [Amphibacillus sp. MSJ-3]MBU5595689.1 tryptophan synthase subunit alpha [Amphibacillus sp. MSJ-3]